MLSSDRFIRRFPLHMDCEGCVGMQAGDREGYLSVAGGQGAGCPRKMPNRFAKAACVWNRMCKSYVKSKTYLRH